MKRAATLLGASVALWWVAAMLTTALHCRPARKMWYPFLEGECLSTTHFLIASSVPNIIQDALVLVLPAREVWRLRVPIRQKLAIDGVFFLGAV